MAATDTTTERLNDLIALVRDGQRFYQHASESVHDAELRELFRDLRAATDELIQALIGKVEANEGDPVSEGTWAGRVRQVYADTRAGLSSNDASVYIRQLEETEDRILQAFEDALETGDVGMHSLLAPEMPKVRACHDRMRDLAKATRK